jgi:diguanylate cyclase (GGDEF)-like protein/PAS domain S-box-containing protein
MAETDDADTRNVAALLRQDGPLHRLPGPAALLGSDGGLLAGNPAGARLLKHGRALNPGRDGAAETVRINDPEGGTVTEIVTVPLNGGQAMLAIGRDISLDRNLREALVESRQRYKDLVEIARDFSWETDSDGRLVFVSPAGGFGWTAREMVGRPAAAFVDDAGGSTESLPFSTREPVDDVELRFRRADGGIAQVVVIASPLLDATGRQIGARGLCRDVTDERNRDAQLAAARNRERLMTYMVRAIRDEIEPAAMLDAACRAIARALAADGCMIARRGEAGLIVASSIGAAPHGTDLLETLAGAAEAPVIVQHDDAALVGLETRYRRQGNGGFAVWRPRAGGDWSEDELALLEDVAGQIGIALEQIAAHERLEFLSTCDPLTSLLNRRTFNERLHTRLSQADGARAEDRRPGVLAYVDLDNFKSVNDNLGHDAGDKALVRVSELLRDSVRRGDLVARLGGDEFALWLDGASAEVASQRARALLDESRRQLEDFVVDPQRRLGMSIGMAAWRAETAEPADRLIARADAAMYDIKRGGKGNFAIAPDAEAGAVATDEVGGA